MSDVSLSDEESKEVKVKISKKAKVSKVKRGKKSTKTAESVKEEAEVKLPKKKASKRKRANSEDEEELEDEIKPEKTPKKRKTKADKEAEAMPLAARTVGSKHFIGAHISSAGGVHNAVTNGLHIGANAFALFLKSQRKWVNPALSDDHETQFLSHCKSHSYDSSAHIIPHGSYLVNLAHPDKDRTKQAYDSFIDDLDRCRRLGIKLYNFHPGNSNGADSKEDAIAHLAKQLNLAHKDPNSGDVVTLLETMAAEGNTIGGTFEELAAIINLVESKERIGVCLDTCHIFAAGYDLRSPESFKKVMDNFEKVIGFKYLRALHVNDSKAPIDSHRDLHANIGTGFLGLRAFHNLMNEPRLVGLPMVLETPIDVEEPETNGQVIHTGEDVSDEEQTKGKSAKKSKASTKKIVEDKGIWAREIKLLESLVGMDTETEEFRKMEAELQNRGRLERERVQDQVDRKAAKDKEKAEKEKKKLMAKGKSAPEKGQSKLKFGNGKAEGASRKKGVEQGTPSGSSDLDD
ncbi:AP endonuclease [Aulographum hederae CBS 113979]|uniref:Apurinic-apyrimidinic endonuclease 1 n=1 Tax=Aulographum hederae CBS 113979 TaxID=1176131 RepID=A0A6G1GWU5_9PEZI|nr:AP endonuclease [Aulographum hederae CBS 113979]